MRHDLSAETRVWAGNESSHPAPWLHDLAARWKGWEGKLAWESLEHELALVARHERFGHIPVQINLRSGFMELDWRVEAFVQLYAGKLEEFAKQASRFFGKDGYLR